MAKEKIKCSKCRKNFDPDLYSGLCPKCGTYNGKRMDSSALEHYISSASEGEKEHRNLHEKYDQGYETAHPVHSSPGRSKSSEQTTESWQKKYFSPAERAALLQEAKDNFEKRQAKERKSERRKKSSLSVFLILLVITIIVAVAFVVISNVYTGLAFTREADLNSTVYVPETEPGQVCFAHTLLEDPILITAHSAGMIEAAENLEGKSIYGVSVSGGSDGYNFDAEVSGVYLQYRYEGNLYYLQPLGSYSIEEFCKKYNIWEDDVLHAYHIGNGDVEDGYFFFLADTEGTQFQLLLQLTRSEEPSVVLQEACIDLEALSELTLTKEEQ